MTRQEYLLDMILRNIPEGMLHDAWKARQHRPKRYHLFEVVHLRVSGGITKVVNHRKSSDEQGQVEAFQKLLHEENPELNSFILDMFPGGRKEKPIFKKQTG